MSEEGMKALKSFRFKAPGIVAFVGLLPWLLKSGKLFADLKLVKDFYYPFFMAIFSVLYVSLELRKPLWDDEMNRTVRKQICDRMIGMIKKRITMTAEELSYIRDEKVFNELSGLFWATVSGDRVLMAQKEMFFQNGRWYSMWFDIFIIYSFMGYLYCGFAGWLNEPFYLAVGLLLLLVTLFAWHCFIPIYRRNHLRLSHHQLTDIEDRLLDSVAEVAQQLLDRRVSSQRTGPSQRGATKP